MDEANMWICLVTVSDYCQCQVSNNRPTACRLPIGPSRRFFPSYRRSVFSLAPHATIDRLC